MRMEHHITYLFDKYKSGQLSAAEQLEWEALLSEEQYSAILASLFDEEWNHFQINLFTSGGEEDLKSNIDFILNFPQQRKVRTIKSKYWAAAIALICCGLTVWLYLLKVDEEIIPGTNKAYITLADGRKIELSDHVDGIEMKDGKMRYADSTGLLPAEVNTSAENLILVTPRGGQYKVKLPDGTQVFLNAASSLSYPSSFANEKQRLVYLKGEGYFEVTKNPDKPFIVQTDRQRIRVLGTKFLVSNYREESISKTTLLEGSVYLQGEAEHVILKPNEQAVLNNGKNLAVHQVNAEDEIAWIKGEFVFNNVPLEEILFKLSLWYDVDVKYSSDLLKKERFEGVVNRFDDIDKVLSLLELANKEVRFELKGRTITVIKSNLY